MTQTIDLNCDVENLRDWFLQNKRNFPWRTNPTPYAVWVSEVMLQQTRANVVAPYFERWMKRFPTLHHLAAASIDEVIKLWEGLGYYSRARYLHQGAQQIVQDFNGQFPQEEFLLQQIKGLGPYTIGAIRSFAFQQKAAAVDGNVLRVLARYFGIEEDIAKDSTRKRIRLHALELLPQEKPWIISEALIELGALVCTTNPQCERCPLQENCKTRQQNKTALLPYKSKKIASTPLYRAVAVVYHDDQILLNRVATGKVMSDLHELPYWELGQEGISLENFSAQASSSLNLPLTVMQALPIVKHQFTRFRVTLYPYLCQLKERFEPSNFPYQWIEQHKIAELAFSSGHRKILQYLQNDVFSAL